MSQPEILRFAWKDMHRIGGLWGALVIFWLCAITLTVLFSAYGNNVVPPSIPTLVHLALTTVAVYALGWSGVTFAAEHEDNTYDLLRAMPVDARHVFFGKLGYGIGSSIAMLMTLAVIIVTYYLAIQSIPGVSLSPGELSYAPLQLPDILIVSAAIPLAVVIGVFWSLRLESPLWAMAISTISTLVVLWVSLGLGVVTDEMTHGQPSHEKREQVYAAFYALLLCAVVYAVDRRLVTAWLPTRTLPFDSESSVGKTLSLKLPPTWMRLIWLHWNQYFLLHVVIGAAATCLAAGVVMSGSAQFVYNSTPLIVIATIIGCFILAISTFRAEHRAGCYRFLGQLSVPTGPYWVSRLLVPGIAMLGVILLGAVTKGPEPMGMTLILLSLFSIGQLCSIACSSVIIAIAMTVVAGGVRCGMDHHMLSLRRPLGRERSTADRFASRLELPSCTTLVSWN